MVGLVKRSVRSPEETQRIEDNQHQLGLVILDAHPVGRGTFESGWR